MASFRDHTAPTTATPRPTPRPTLVPVTKQFIYIVYASHKASEWLGFLLLERGSKHWALLGVDDTSFCAAEMDADSAFEAIASLAAKQAVADGHQICVKRFNALDASDQGAIVYSIG